jgi:hypothetical protein
MHAFGMTRGSSAVLTASRLGVCWTVGPRPKAEDDTRRARARRPGRVPRRVLTATTHYQRCLGPRRPCEAWLRHDAGMTLGYVSAPGFFHVIPANAGTQRCRRVCDDSCVRYSLSSPRACWKHAFGMTRASSVMLTASREGACWTVGPRPKAEDDDIRR